MELARIETNGIALRVAQDGPTSGPLLLLLLGFPESHEAWHRVMGPLAALGWRVWAPDMRGYDLSDKPRSVRAYRSDELSADVAGLIDAAGARRAVIVGHDWGGLVAWHVARRFPERVAKLVIMNAPHPRTVRRRLLTDPRQLVRSSYVFAFQVPWLPERLMRAGNWRALERSLMATSRPGTFGAELLRRYRIAWARPGAITSMVNYYRAAARSLGDPGLDAPVAAPTLILWGREDTFLVPGLATDSARQCADARVEYVDGATHWLHHEEPDRVVASISGFLGPATH